MNIKQINTDMRTACHAKGIKGRGIVFAVIDTGTAKVGPLAMVTEAGNLKGCMPGEDHGTMVASVINQWRPDSKILAYNHERDGAIVNAALEDVIKRVKADTKNRYIVNLSFSSGKSQHTDRMTALIDQLVGMNVPVFAAAGNDGKEAIGLIPATLKNVICGAALSIDGTPAPFSNSTGEMDFADDGVDVDVLDMTGAKTKASGTSVAIPTIASKGALFLCQNLKLSEPELFSTMKAAALDMYSTGFDPNTGWGFIRVASVQAPSVPVESVNIKEVETPMNDTKRRSLRLTTPVTIGVDVKDAQTKLLAHGFSPGSVDGVFGKNTDTATKAFQTARKLMVDGVIGKQTWAALDKAPETVIPVTDRIKHFIAYLKAEVANGSIYVWGSQGQSTITEAWIRKRETSTKNADRAMKLWQSRLARGMKHIRAFDCSGLIVYYLNREGLYKGDMSAQGLYSKSKKLTRADLVPGDLVFRTNLIRIYHVGVYIGNGLVIEAKGRDDGVVMRDINASGKSYWNRYGRLGLLEG